MPLPLALARRSAAPRLHPSAPLPGTPRLRAVARPAVRWPSPLRTSLRASTAEGIAAEVVGAATSTATYTAWALHLGCGTAAIALLGALPFVAHVLQLPAAALTSRFGARRVALVAVAISRQAYLPLVVLPFLPVGPGAARALLLGAAALHQGLGIVCNNGWVAWMGELVPRRLRGRYFGRRTATTTLAAAVAGLAVGVVLDRAPGGQAATLAGLALLTCVTGAISTATMARQHGGRRPRGASVARTPFAAALRARGPRRWAVLQAVCGLASGMAVPFFGVFVLRDRALGFAFLASYGAVAAVARTVAAPAWGRLVDRRGARGVVVAANAIAVAGPLLWIAAAGGGAGLLVAEAALAGISAAGTGVAGLVFPLSLCGDAERPVYHAVFAVSGGLAFAAGAAAGAALAGALPAAAVAGPLTLPFAGCAALRAAAVWLSCRLPEPAPARR